MPIPNIIFLFRCSICPFGNFLPFSGDNKMHFIYISCNLKNYTHSLIVRSAEIIAFVGYVIDIADVVICVFFVICFCACLLVVCYNMIIIVCGEVYSLICSKQCKYNDSDKSEHIFSLIQQSIAECFELVIIKVCSLLVKW